jgi:hypothetical protein
MIYTVTKWEDIGGNRILRNAWTLQAKDANEAVLQAIPFEDTLEGEFTSTQFHGEYRSPELLVRAVANR